MQPETLEKQRFLEYNMYETKSYR